MGVEQSYLKASKTAISQTQRAKSGALNDKIDLDLAEIVTIWPNLPEHIKAEIKALVKRHKTEKK